MRLIHYTLFILLASLGLASCSGKQDIFSVRGEFTKLNEAELYFWTPVGGHGKMDTITVRDGKFAYESPQTEPGWYTLMFPNMSEQVIFAEPGLEVKISADATHLRQMKIDGGKDNKLMAEFRQSLGEETSDAALAQKAAAFIPQHPESIVSVYLLQKYLVQQPDADVDQVRKLTALLLEKQPEQADLITLNRTLEGLKKTAVGSPAGDFRVRDIKGLVHELKDFKDSTLLICFWANWEQDSRDDMRNLKKKKKEFSKDVAILNISLDLQKISWRTAVRIDSMPGHNVCDLNAWESPIVSTYGVNQLPTYIVVKNGKVASRTHSLDKLKIGN